MFDEQNCKEEKICRFGQITQTIIELTGILKDVNPNNLTSFDKLGVCIQDQCAHWVEIHPAVQREEHDGGKELIYKIGVETHRNPYKIRYGVWGLKASGKCGLGGGKFE